jgi:hypothetical protein
MNENEIGGIVVNCAAKVYMRLGPGICWSLVINGKLDDRFILLRVSV